MKIKKTIKISTYFAITTSFLVTFATLGIAIYALFFLNEVVGYLVPQDALYEKVLMFKDGLQRLVIAFLTFGLISSYYMTKSIITPLTNLISSSKKIAEGKFENRLEETNFDEVNNLILNFNSMAKSLEDIYNNLETKVQERTKDLEKANTEIKNTQVMMVHSEKMRSLGQLVAGITHEINNPINFVYGNMTHLKNYSNALLELITTYESMENDLTNDEREELKQIKDDIDLNFLREDLPSLIKSCKEGTERTKNIILDLKNFSRLDKMTITSINIEKEIDTILNILHNKIKNKIEIVKEYDKDFPLIDGYGGQLNQVFMNILDNSCYAIKDYGKIYIRLKKSNNDVIIEFEDTGCGIEKDKCEKIFEPFFTTKPTGEGTGLGMSISYKIIKQHNGDIKIESQPNKGTKFTITLPVEIRNE